MNIRNVLFYNKKGGQGKTTLATNYAKKIKANFYTNDENNFTDEVFSIKINMIPHNQQIEEVEIDDEKSNVFDFGGFTDDRVRIVAGFCDVCVVPIFYQGAIDIRAAQETMQTLKSENKNSIFVINNTEKELIQDLHNHLSKMSRTFVIPHSLFLQENNKSIFDIYKNATGLQQYTIKNKVMPYFDELFNYLGV